MKQETTDIPVAELSEPQLTRVTGGQVTRAEVDAIRHSTLQNIKGSTDAFGSSGEVSPRAQSIGAVSRDFLDFATFVGGQQVADAIVPPKNKNGL